MVSTHGNVPYDESLERPGELLEGFRLGDQVVLEALRTQPFAFLEHQSPDRIPLR